MAIQASSPLTQRLQQWVDNKQLDVGKLSTTELKQARTDLGVSKTELQIARAALLKQSNVATEKAGANFAKNLDSANPQQVQVGTQSMAATPMGVYLNGQDALTSKGLSVDLEAMEQRFDVLAYKLKKNPAAIKKLRAEFKQIVDELTPFIDTKQGELSATREQLDKKEALLGWFKRNIGMFSPDDVKQLRQQVDGLENSVGESKAYRGGARIGMRSGQQADSEMSPATWNDRISQKQAAISQRQSADPAWAGEVAGLVKAQDQLEETCDQAQLAQRAVADDVKDLKGEVKWHQKWKWLDVVIGGESARGALYRAGKAMNKDAKSLVGELEGVRERGNDAVVDEVNSLLKAESPEYRAKRERYDLLKPAWDNVGEVLEHAKDAQYQLDQSETWIARRDFLRQTEPTEYEWVDKENADGSTTRVQEETWQHKNWETEYSQASSNASWAISSAEDAIHDVNHKLPLAEAALNKMPEHQHHFSEVDDDIRAFWSALGGFSIEGWNVDKSQGQMHDIEMLFSRIQGNLEPEYNQHERYVTTKISQRRGELLELDAD